LPVSLTEIVRETSSRPIFFLFGLCPLMTQSGKPACRNEIRLSG
jgi:hypothetical protein